MAQPFAPMVGSCGRLANLFEGARMCSGADLERIHGEPVNASVCCCRSGDAYPGTMWSALGRTTTILALCLAIGLHWAALQSVAWTAMLIEYSKHATLRQALTQTFDGDHPCAMCKGINAAQHSPKKQQTPPVVSKPDLICTTRTFELIQSFERFQSPRSSTVFSEDGESPPVPPPRLELS